MNNKLVEAGFQNYFRSVSQCEKTVFTEQRLKEIRAAFFAGAFAHLLIIARLTADENSSTEEFNEALAGIETELREFANDPHQTNKEGSV